MPTVKLRDGDITLYTRGDSANWYAAFRLPDGGRLQQSLKTQSKAEAKERAVSRHDELKWRSRLGLSQDTVTFSQVAAAWLKELMAEVAAGQRKLRTVLDGTVRNLVCGAIVEVGKGACYGDQEGSSGRAAGWSRGQGRIWQGRSV